MPTTSTIRLVWLPVVALLAGVMLLGASGAWGNPRHARARAAHAASAIDTAHLHLVKNNGEGVIEEGRASGTLPGSVKAYIDVGATVTVRFTITLKGGNITGSGSGKLKGNPAEPSFSGTMSVTRGTGHYAHASGKGGFYGILNRSTLAMTVQTTGTLNY